MSHLFEVLWCRASFSVGKFEIAIVISYINIKFNQGGSVGGGRGAKCFREQMPKGEGEIVQRVDEYKQQ